MTREQTIQKIADHFAAHGEDREYVMTSLATATPIWASLALLEALGIVTYDDDQPPTP
jgi:hypothetical protein